VTKSTEIAANYMQNKSLTVVVALLASAAFLACVTSDEGSGPQTPDATDAKAAMPAQVEDENLIPCAPRSALQNVCQRCHQDPPVRGAPFPLVRRSDITRDNIRERMITQLTTRRMPARPETIKESTRSDLLHWLEQGAPALALPIDDCTSTDAGGEEVPNR
jgi:hypothetical protein